MDTSTERHAPVLPLRDVVVYPHMAIPLFVGREKSIKALEEVMGADKQILLASQTDAGEDNPSEKDIYRTGVVASAYSPDPGSIATARTVRAGSSGATSAGAGRTTSKVNCGTRLPHCSSARSSSTT